MMLYEQPERSYLYCFFRESASQTFTSKGMGDRGDAVTSIHYRDLGAVVSASPLAEYESSRRNMMTHTRALEEIMERYAILPVRFNTSAPDQTTVYQLLCHRYDELQGMLTEMMGKVEMGLKALWYEGVVFNEIVAEHADIRRLRDALQERPPEQTYFERIHLGEMIENALEQKRQAEESLILDALHPHVHKLRTSPTISDRMIVNAAFLVERKQEPDLDAAIRTLDAQMGQRILFRYVGPVPPYNFVDLVLTWNGRNTQ